MPQPTIDTERFIAEVRAQPLLYQKQHEEYNEPESKQRAWREVAAAVYHDWESVGRSETYERILLLQKKWRSLRDAFNRELRMRARGSSRIRKKYIYYKSLRFIRQDEGEQSSSSSEDDPLVSPPKPKQPRRTRPRQSKRPSVKHEAASFDGELPASGAEYDDHEYGEPAAAAQQEPEPDSDRLFLLSYAEEMRRLPAHVRMWARAQVSRVMQEAVAHCCASDAPPARAPPDIDTRSLHALKHAPDHAGGHFS